MSQPNWITLHRLCFPDVISAQHRTFDAPVGPEVWRFCPGQVLGDDGLPTWTSDVWCGLALHRSRDEAEALIAEFQERFPPAREAVEEWHGLLRPFAHHGEVKWRDKAEADSAIRIDRGQGDGALIVVTTAGFNTRDPERISTFARGVGEVIDFYGTVDGNLRRGVFNGGFDLRDGFTVSLWRDDKAMIRAAYGDGLHRGLMDRSRVVSMMDRSSFTRARLETSIGSWDGDPFGTT